MLSLFSWAVFSLSATLAVVKIATLSVGRDVTPSSGAAFLNPSLLSQRATTFGSNRLHKAMHHTLMSANVEQSWKGAAAISKLTASTAEKVFDIEKIKSILPHRFPFLLVDKVLEFQPGERAVGVKQISMNEDQFNGHFPQRAVMPGVLQVEALAQLGGIVALQAPVSDGKGDFFFAGVNGVKWKKPVVPGDTLVMEVEMTSWKPKFGIAKMAGRGYVDGQIAIDIKEMTFALVK